jgi:glycosyltransferase involved in cell wall biosynthesis
MAKRKIALIHYSAPPVVGGVEGVLAQHARLMCRAGYDVRVLAGRGEEWALEKGVHLVSAPLLDSLHPRVLDVKAALDRGEVPAEFEPLAEEIVARLREGLEGVDVVVAHNVCSLHKNLALTAALRRMHAEGGQPKWVLWHHDLAWTTPRYRAELHDGSPWDLLREDWGTAHVCVSESRRAELIELMRMSRERVVVVPNGVDPSAFLKIGRQAQALAEAVGWGQAWPRLLLPVRITPRKNVELALHTLAILRRDHPRAALVVTGPPGPHNPENAAYLDRLRRLRDDLGVSASAHFLADHASGYLPDEVIADFYRLADALLLPSREEGFGIPLVEAGLARLPVFCADIPSLRALGGDDATYFSPDADPGAVASLLVEHFRRDRISGMAARARLEYSWDEIYRERIAPLLEP